MSVPINTSMPIGQSVATSLLLVKTTPIALAVATQYVTWWTVM